MCQELLPWHPRQSQSRVALLQRALWEPCALDGEGRAHWLGRSRGVARCLAAGARSTRLRSRPLFEKPHLGQNGCWVAVVLPNQRELRLYEMGAAAQYGDRACGFAR
jgi:hypothetical protein